MLALEAINAETGDVMAREQVEVAAKEQVLTSLGVCDGEAAREARRIAGPDPAIRRAAGAGDDSVARCAARLFARARCRADGSPSRSHSAPQRAIELDPNFAMAQALLSGVYANTGRSAEAPSFSRKAFELRDRVSERERFFISWRYYLDAEQAWDKALDLGTIVDQHVSARSVCVQQPRHRVSRVRPARAGGRGVPRSHPSGRAVCAALWESRRVVDRAQSIR